MDCYRPSKCIAGYLHKKEKAWEYVYSNACQGSYKIGIFRSIVLEDIMGFKIAKWKITWEQKGQLPNVKAMMPALMSVSATLARDEWIKVARANLRTSRDAYIGGIQQPEMQGKNAVIKLIGWLPNALEQGCSSV